MDFEYQLEKLMWIIKIQLRNFRWTNLICRWRKMSITTIKKTGSIFTTPKYFFFQINQRIFVFKDFDSPGPKYYPSAPRDSKAFSLGKHFGSFIDKAVSREFLSLLKFRRLYSWWISNIIYFAIFVFDLFLNNMYNFSSSLLISLSMGLLS